MFADVINQRTVRMTLFTKEGGWRRYQIKALKMVFGKSISSNALHPEEIVLLGEVSKSQIADVTNEAKFTSHKIIGFDNPRLHHWKPF